MKKNMGALDRVLRIVVAVGIAALYFTHRINGLLAIVLGIVAVVFILTSFMGHCPGYKPLGFSTLPKTPASKK